MLNKKIQKMKLRKNKRVKDEKKTAERERALPRNRQVQNYYMKKLLGILVLCYRIFSNLKVAGLNPAK